MKIGVVAVQGSVEEHEEALARTGWKDLEVVQVRKPEQLEGVNGIILPGGESTTISKMLKATGLFSALQKLAEEGMPMMGTCAGCVLLASSLTDADNKKKTPLLSLMDMSVSRNAFGRQKESFESEVLVENMDKFHGVFIRAPAIMDVWGDCRPLAMLDKTIVMAEQDNLIALSFHPELTPDSRIHEYFLKKVESTL